jgi:hypothetical protein
MKAWARSEFRWERVARMWVAWAQHDVALWGGGPGSGEGGLSAPALTVQDALWSACPSMWHC